MNYFNYQEDIMYGTPAKPKQPALVPVQAPNGERLTRFDRWWVRLTPPLLKRVLPPWQISAGLVSLVALHTQDQALTTMVMLFWASISFTWLFNKLDRFIGQWRWIIPAYHAGLYPLVVMPAMAQAGGAACSTGGLFSGISNFVGQLFSSVSFAGGGGGSLSNMICQVLGFFIFMILMAFLGALAYVCYQVGFNKQPLSLTLEPLTAFLVFAGGATFITGAILGSATT